MKSKGFIIGVPCKRCSKTVRADYWGVCMDCADDMGVSEVFEKGKDYKKNLEAFNDKYGLQPSIKSTKKRLKVKNVKRGVPKI